jgi:hypothetical protein
LDGPSSWAFTVTAAAEVAATAQIFITQRYIHYTVKKRFAIFLSPAGMSLTKLYLERKLFPARENLVSEIPTGDGKFITFFTV